MHEDSNSEFNQKKVLTMRMIILIGSVAIVKANIAKGGPNTIKAKPKKSTRAIIISNNF